MLDEGPIHQDRVFPKQAKCSIYRFLSFHNLHDVDNIWSQIRRIWNSSKLWRHLPSSPEYTKWKIVSLERTWSVSFNLISSLRYLILYIWMVLLLVGTLSTFIYWYLTCSADEKNWFDSIKALSNLIFGRLLHWISPGLRRRHLEYHLKVSFPLFNKRILSNLWYNDRFTSCILANCIWLQQHQEQQQQNLKDKC